ncbi:hypothetical protein RHGRI_011745 [Rhododendron griersonianum]|uniref:EGF-like domain-containing protein n=1 Tax=Rhododendron griersonianum TaxID=479676 RepID=A0AAV6KP73_9ERIC|nr:hypothetical protein RHGRI_011745 [Rhododendron griersonianum]
MHLIVESIAFSIPKFQLYMCSSLNMYLHAVLLLFLSCLLLPQPTLGTDMAGTPNFTANVAAITNSSFFIAKPGCPLYCGNITVPYPFGFGESRCYHSWFQLTCDTSSDPPMLFLGDSDSNLDVSSISQTQVRVGNIVTVQCYNETGDTIDELSDQGSWMNLGEPGEGLTFSDTANKFTVVGCNVYAWFSWWNEDRDFSTGCLSGCSGNSEVLPGNCTGIGCCQIDIPKGLTEFNASLGMFYRENETEVSSTCSYAFLGEQDHFKFEGKSDFGFPNTDTVESRIMRNVPVVLDFVIGNQSCSDARNSGTWQCHGDDPLCTDSDSGNGGYRCTCKHGYEGNPYLNPGCKDIDECSNATLNNCHENAKCTNTAGSFNCTCRDHYNGNGTMCVPKDSQLSGIKLSLGTYVIAQLIKLASNPISF